MRNKKDMESTIMKYIVPSILASVLMASSITSFADKITITGQPAILEQNGEYYTVPSTATPSTSGAYYVKIGDKMNACYLKIQPALAKLTPQNVVVKVQDQTTTWSCYELDPNYFVVQ